MKISDQSAGGSLALRPAHSSASGWNGTIPHIVLEKWENEGGHVLPPVSPRQRSASPSQSRKIAADLAEQLRLMSDTLAQDYANGRVGQRFNTYAHRSRVIRQVGAELKGLEAAELDEGLANRQA